MRYRHFRNADPPALVALWNEALTHRGAVELRSHTALENAVFNKPYFDPAGFIVAEDDAGKITGFAHAGFGPNDDESALDQSVGVICAIAVRPDCRRTGVGSEMLRRAETYLRDRGSSSLRAGAARPNKPFYVGVYGGSNAAGFLKSDPEIEPFLLKNGYRPDRRVNIFDRRLDMPLNIVDSRFGLLRRKYEGQALPQARLGTWFREAVFGPLEPFEFRIDDKATGQTAARALFWEMTDYGWRWGAPPAGVLDVQVRNDLRSQGLGKFLLAQLLRHLQEQYFAVVEVQVPDGEETAARLFRSLGFVQVDIGVTYLKSP
ncbi:MAG TPA: GNAT family N-acetyltransferase [Gemmataceae bacterium]|jgi:ribosomal protein S18 acetylase RimI-like enzyme|nr:GNAT family N-acetyltransferase [Gemmataceae bacterium]